MVESGFYSAGDVHGRPKIDGKIDRCGPYRPILSFLAGFEPVLSIALFSGLTVDDRTTAAGSCDVASGLEPVISYLYFSAGMAPDRS